MRGNNRLVLLSVAAAAFILAFFTVGHTTVTHRLLPSTNTEDHRVDNLPTDDYIASRGIVRPPFRPGSEKLAVIIENRNVTQLAPVILSFIAVLPPSWRFRFYGSTQSIAFLRQSLPIRYHQHTGKLEIFEMPDALPMNGAEAFSYTLTHPAFWTHIMYPAKHVLFFQTDSIMCANAGRSIDDYLEYAYVGAPWRRGGPGGNGGLSLRNVEVMTEILSKYQRKAGGKPEDLWYSYRLPLITLPPGIKLADRQALQSFAVESIEYPTPLGYHLGGSGKIMNKPVWGTLEKREAIYKYCPEVTLILDMVPSYQFFPCFGNQTQVFDLTIPEDQRGNWTQIKWNNNRPGVDKGALEAKPTEAANARLKKGKSKKPKLSTDGG